jgi:hypothetical protein
MIQVSKTFLKNNSDMQHRLALTLAYLKLCKVSSDTLVSCIFLNADPQYQILLKEPIFSKQLQELPLL